MKLSSLAHCSVNNSIFPPCRLTATQPGVMLSRGCPVRQVAFLTLLFTEHQPNALGHLLSVAEVQKTSAPPSLALEPVHFVDWFSFV